MDKIIVIDGNSLVNRAFYALPPMLSEGRPTQAVYGFTTMLIRMIQTYHPTHMAVAFDLPEPTFRHKRYSGYKATRHGMPDDLACQMQPLKDLLAGMNIKILEKAGYEADDIIGTVSKRFNVKTYIVTGDRDSFQLIDDTTTVVLTKRGITEVLELDEEKLKQEYELSPSQVVEFKAIAGDSSDNIPGVTGIGEKGAKQLLSLYGTLDGVYENLELLSAGVRNKLVQGKEQAYMSKELARIVTDAPIDCTLDDCRLEYPFPLGVKSRFLDLGFKSLAARAELFSDSEGTAPEPKSGNVEITVAEIRTENELKEALRNVSEGDTVAVDIGGETADFALSADREYTAGLICRLDEERLGFHSFIGGFKSVLENPAVRKVVYDSKKLMKSMGAYGIAPVNLWDVKLARYVADFSMPNDTLDKVLKDIGVPSAYRACALLRQYDELSAVLKKDGLDRVFYELEQPLVQVLYDMESEGFKLDLKRLDELSVFFTREIARLTGEVYEFCGQEFNINSPKQLAKVLFEDMKLPYPRKSATYSTGADVLQLIADEHPVINKILEYRTVAKLNSTYVEGLKKLTGEDGVVHTEFRQTVTATGRLSSAEPNLQNIPVREEIGKQLREIFVARQGRTLVSADYSQIELRLLAHFSGDEILRKTYLSGEDVHAYTAAKVFGVEKDEVTDKQRRMAKAVNFGIIYGISDFGLAQNTNMPRRKAKQYIDEYFKHFPSVKGYLDSSVEEAKKNGYAVTLMGRRRKIPELFSSQYVTRQFGERVAMNMPLQGTAADIIKAAMIAVHSRLKNMKSRLILQVHDELIVEADDSEVEQVETILRDCMENAVELTVPLTVDIAHGKSWSDC